MFNPSKLFKLKGSWDRFAMNHPKFVNFIAALRNNYIKEGTVIEINVKTEEGKQSVQISGLTKRILIYLPKYLKCIKINEIKMITIFIWY